MKIATNNQVRKKSTIIKVLGTSLLALLIIASIIATADTAVAAGNDKAVKNTGKVTLHIVNEVGSDIIVAWTKAGTTDRVFKVSVPDGETRTIKVPTGKFEQYVKVKQDSNYYPYQVITKPKHTQLKSGYEYTSIYEWTYFGNLKSIPDSKAKKIFK